VQGGNYQEYFAKKMAELRARGRGSTLAATVTVEEETSVIRYRYMI